MTESTPATTVPTGAVVVGVDNSDSAIGTAVWAAEHSVQQGLPLIIVHCSGGSSDHPLGELVGIAGRVRALRPEVVPTFEVRSGDAVDILTEMSRTAALIVVGTAGLDARDPEGSVPVRLAARSLAPVAVVSAGSRADGPVLVGVDGSPRSLAALEFAAIDAQRSGAALLVLMAWVEVVLDQRTGRLTEIADWDAETSRCGLELTRLLTVLQTRFPELPVTGELVHGRAAGALIDRTADCRQVVVGRRGAGRLHSLALGSTSRALLAAASCVVVVLPDPAGPMTTDRHVPRPATAVV